MKKLVAVIALASSMGVAYAEPVALTDSQMDNVSAAGSAFSTALASALGVVAAGTTTTSLTTVEALEVIPTQAGQITVDLATSVSTSEAIAL